MKSLWYKFVCIMFGHRWRIIARSSEEDGRTLYWRGPPKGCFSMCVICRLQRDDLPRPLPRRLNGSGDPEH